MYGINADDLFKVVSDNVSTMKKAFGIKPWKDIGDQDEMQDMQVELGKVF